MSTEITSKPRRVVRRSTPAAAFFRRPPEPEESATSDIVFGQLPPRRRTTGRPSGGGSRVNKWDALLAQVIEAIGDGDHAEPARIAQGMSYASATSTCSSIRCGKHGEGWLATFKVEDDVEPIAHPHKNSDFKHYEVWVAYLPKYTGDTSPFEGPRARQTREAA